MERPDGPWEQHKRPATRAGTAAAAAAARAATPAAASSKRRLVAAVLLAQFLSLCLAVTGISSALLAAAGIAVPTSQSVLNYALLALTFGSSRLARGGRLARPWWCYALLALVDVEANFLVVKAYAYTSLTSVTLLDCFTIPAVIALSFFVLGARYRRAHYAAAALCVGGLVLLVASEGVSSTAGAAPLLGDALVVAGALLYSVSNVTQELFLGAASTAEVLGMVGAFGAPIAAAQALALERGAWAALLAPPRAAAAGGRLDLALVGGALAAFTAALYTFSALVPVVLVWGGATALNLSLLTSDAWAAAARVLLFGGFGGAGGWFAASLAAVAAGLCLYASAGSPLSGGGAGLAVAAAAGGEADLEALRAAAAAGGFYACSTDEGVACAPGGRDGGGLWRGCDPRALLQQQEALLAAQAALLGQAQGHGRLGPRRGSWGAAVGEPPRGASPGGSWRDVSPRGASPIGGWREGGGLASSFRGASPGRAAASPVHASALAAYAVQDALWAGSPRGAGTGAGAGAAHWHAPARSCSAEERERLLHGSCGSLGGHDPSHPEISALFHEASPQRPQSLSRPASAGGAGLV